MMVSKQKKPSVLFLFVLLIAMVMPWYGCTDDEAGIDILAPIAGERVKTHSVHFSVSLDPDLDPTRLLMVLNQEDMSSHLRISGSEAEGYVSGMTEGENLLQFTAPDSSGEMRAASVEFSFVPIPVEAIELAETYSLPGLEDIVDVLIDPWGVPHSYARGDNLHDILYVQGYMTAKYRLFQVDMFRKAAQGRLVELFGNALDDSVLEMDLFYRTMFLTYEEGKIGYIYDLLAQDLAERDPEKFAYLTHFVKGINDFIEDLKQGRNDAVWPQQYHLLNLACFFINPFAPAYEIEPMTEAQVLAIGRLQQYELSGTLYEEISRKLDWDAIRDGELNQGLPGGTLQDLFRSQPPSSATVLQPGEDYYMGRMGRKGSVGRLRAEKSSACAGMAEKAMPGLLDKGRSRSQRGLLDRIKRGREMLWGSLERPFSNNWILGPSMTASGFPLLCNDPHLAMMNPSVLYPVHGDNKSFGGGDFNISGYTFPGLPGILVGQNERLAWGGTVAYYDVTDVYEEEVLVDGEDKWVVFNGNTVPVERTLQTFRVRCGDDIVIPIDYVPHHGPQTPGDPYSPDPGLSAENNLTMRWTGHFLSREMEAILGLFDATGMDDFFASLEGFWVGSQNFVGASVDGEIGYFPMANIPVREEAALSGDHPPYLPMPGTGGYEWVGRVPTEQIPQARNPSRGWLVTANNDITGTAQDNDVLNDELYLYYHITSGFRGDRIMERILELDREERDLERMKEIQGDHLSLPAQRLRPYFLGALENQDALALVPALTPTTLDEVRSRVADWDLKCTSGLPDFFTGAEPSNADLKSSIASSLFFVWLNLLTEAVFDDELARAEIELGAGDRLTALLHILEDVNAPPASPDYVHTSGDSGQSLLWDNIETTDWEETRDEVIVTALAEALSTLADLMKSHDMNDWQWGKIHTITFELEGVGGMVKAFNLPGYGVFDQFFREFTGQGTPGYPRSGGFETVDPAYYALNGLNFNTKSGPAMRMVVELEEGVMRAYSVFPGGMTDLQPEANIFKPVAVDNESHYGDQIPLWLANKYRPQYIFWEDVTAVVGGAGKARIRFQGE